MKNEYFGDTRDLFKYDLALELLRGVSSLRRFTFVPMLTPNEDNGHGRRTNYKRVRAGRGNERLVRFLEECVHHGRRNIRELESLFHAGDVKYTAKLVIYKKDQYFRNSDRKAYFDSLPRHMFLKAVILVDPDNGLEVKSGARKGEKYLKYEEAQSLWKRMGIGSVLILFQYIPRVQRRPYFRTIAQRLAKLGQQVYYISDNQVVFFILPKGKRLLHCVRRVLSSYAMRNDVLVDHHS